jgi:hypothetical protein
MTALQLPEVALLASSREDLCHFLSVCQAKSEFQLGRLGLKKSVDL